MPIAYDGRMLVSSPAHPIYRPPPLPHLRLCNPLPLPHLRPCNPSFFLPSQMYSSLIHHTLPALSSNEVFFIEEIRRLPYSTRDGLYHLHRTCNYTVYRSG